jgi:LytS/YehU family sensor histidine kinase
VEWDIPESLHFVHVPALILQPLVENAVKYGVARTSAPVRIRIAAQRDGDDDIILTVEDIGATSGALPKPASGLGIGLANVRSRLAARYGDVGTLSSAATASGWLSSVTIPARG